MVRVRCLVPRAASAPPDGELSLPAGATVATATRTLGLPPGTVAVSLVNGAPAGPDTPLVAGDRLSLIPPITGG